MFRINDNKGFSVTFDNGYTVSVQFGPGNYSSNYQLGFDSYGKPMTSDTAETALLDPDGNFVPYKGNGNFVPYKGDDVQGYQSPDDVIALMNYAASL